MNQFQLNRRPLLLMLAASGGLLIVIACMLAFAGSVSAHGYVDSPGSRAIKCKNGLNTNCGPVIYEPQSLEGVKGFPISGPADGQIASAGHSFFSNLDQQSPTRWHKSNLSSGPNTFTWKFTILRPTTNFRYFITKPNWDPNAPLTRSQLDLTPFCTIEGNGQSPPITVSHNCNVPARTGYHVILAVWDIQNTPNAFYNVIDVQFGPEDPIGPPTNLIATAVGSTTASLSWGAPENGHLIAAYEIYSGAIPTPLLVVSGNNLSANLTNLQSNTTYSFTVKAVGPSGDRTRASNAVTVTTTPDSTATPWAPNTAYAVNALVSYNGATYKCIQAHTSLAGWQPSATPALWQLQP
ncbi:lytic polysaccharide monooxygenase [Paenibacillus sp. GCM10027627]|uniref:lytic polysaccharide monooxygenase n=1 Tax=unclassified Paenibacillus TaxID=185978 RepID=UPI00363FFF74